MPLPLPLTVKDAALILDVAEAHVRLMIKKGRIEATPFNGVWMVSEASVKHYAKVYRQPGRGRPRKAKNTRSRRNLR